MCEMHNLWCETLKQTITFPQPDSTYRTPTAEEYEEFGHGKPIPERKRVDKFVPNLVVYEDVSADGVVTTVPSDGVVDIVEPYSDPVLARVWTRSYPAAAAGSATQRVTDVVVTRGVVAGPPSRQLSINDAAPTLHVLNREGKPYGFSDVVLDRIEHFVRQSPLPWQVRGLLPGQFNLMPDHDEAMLAISLTSVIRGLRIAAESILRESAAQPTLRFEDRDVLMLDDRLLYLMRARGEGPVI